MMTSQFSFTIWKSGNVDRKKIFAFSLVEVTFALGVVSFGLLSIIAVMPVGLKSMRQAIDQTVEGLVAQDINGKVLLTPFSQLSVNFSGQTFYYDQQGTFLTNTPAATPVLTHYWVETTLNVNPAIYPGAVSGTGPGSLSNSLNVVNIQIITAASATAQTKQTNSYAVWVPNSGT